MYFASIESNRADMAKHNETLRINAAYRLKKLSKMDTHKHIPCAPNRKAKAKLDARVVDWQRSIDDPLNRSKDMSGYNKPGSVKFH